MKVRQLIAALLSENQDSEVLIRDADTSWLLPVYWGDHQYCKDDDDALGKVVIHGDYSDVN